MVRIFLAIAIMVGGVIPQQLTDNSNKIFDSGELRNIVENSSLTSQKVFVEDFTGLM